MHHTTSRVIASQPSACLQVRPTWDAEAQTPLAADTLAQAAVQVLTTAEPTEKAQLTHRIFQRLHADPVPIGRAAPPERAEFLA